MNISTGVNMYVVVVLLTMTLMVTCNPIVKSDPTSPVFQREADAIFRCRQKCFSNIIKDFKHSGNLIQYLRCQISSDCNMCWDYCRAVALAQSDLAISMCNDKIFCTRGCKLACKFYRVKLLFGINDMISSNEV